MSQALIAPTIAAPEFTFTVPERERKHPKDPQSFTLRSFTYGQEIDALKATRVTGATLEYELLQRCVVRLDGKPTDQARNFLEEFSPQVRTLMVIALNKVSTPDPKAVSDFLESMTTEM